MTQFFENKYAHLEEQVDEMLSTGNLILFPPGFIVFLITNLLLMIGVAALIFISQNVLFPDQIEQAMTFSFSAGIILAIAIVTPPFFVIRGFRKALLYTKFLTIALLTVTSAFALSYFLTNGTINLFVGAGILSLVVAYLLENSNSYQLLSIFTAKRRALVLENKI